MEEMDKLPIEKMTLYIRGKEIETLKNFNNFFIDKKTQLLDINFDFFGLYFDTTKHKCDEILIMIDVNYNYDVEDIYMLYNYIEV